MTTSSAFAIATLLLILGLIVLYAFNPMTAMFGAISVFLYTCAYTPLKTITPLSVFVGAIPGAIPFMLGWISSTGRFGIEPAILFMIQFFWQFPHFWAIGWLMKDDYKRAGINMLPTGLANNTTALQIILYILWTIVISVFPVLGLSGDLRLTFAASIFIIIIGIILLRSGFKLYNSKSQESAKKLMVISIFYITAIQWIYVIDKFI
jgi:protoheme IX farnesyltransferase